MPAARALVAGIAPVPSQAHFLAAAVMFRHTHVALILIFTACSHPSRQGGGSVPNVISQQEIEASGAVTAYEAVQKLRGTFLSDRGKTTLLGRASTKPVVFVDGVEYGEFESLRNIAAGGVASIRLYRAWEAQQKFGQGKMSGVIEVMTRTQ